MSARTLWRVRPTAEREVSWREDYASREEALARRKEDPHVRISRVTIRKRAKPAACVDPTCPEHAVDLNMGPPDPVQMPDYAAPAASKGESCATSGCFHGNLTYFERGGVGSWYCSECYPRVLRLAHREDVEALNGQLATMKGSSATFRTGYRVSDAPGWLATFSNEESAIEWSKERTSAITIRPVKVRTVVPGQRVIAAKPDPETPHLIEGRFQSDKYPSCPRGKVPLSTKDPTAQDLLWQYAQRRRINDAQFSADLETALRNDGYAPKADSLEPTELNAEAKRIRSIHESRPSAWGGWQAVADEVIYWKRAAATARAIEDENRRLSDRGNRLAGECQDLLANVERLEKDRQENEEMVVTLSLRAAHAELDAAVAKNLALEYKTSQPNGIAPWSDAQVEAIKEAAAKWTGAPRGMWSTDFIRAIEAAVRGATPAPREPPAWTEKQREAVSGRLKSILGSHIVGDPGGLQWRRKTLAEHVESAWLEAGK